MGVYINIYFSSRCCISFLGQKISVHKQQLTTNAYLVTYLDIIQSINKMILISLRVTSLSHTHSDSRIAGFFYSPFIIKFVLFAVVSFNTGFNNMLSHL